jgi:hypothetical protein
MNMTVRKNARLARPKHHDQHHAVAAAYKGGHLSRQCGPRRADLDARSTPAIEHDGHAERMEQRGPARNELYAGRVHNNRHPPLRQLRHEPEIRPENSAAFRDQAPFECA